MRPHFFTVRPCFSTPRFNLRFKIHRATYKATARSRAGVAKRPVVGRQYDIENSVNKFQKPAKLPKRLFASPKDSKTIGFGGFLVTFSAAKKSPAPEGAEHSPARRAGAETSPSNALRGTAFATSPFRGGKGRAGRAQKPLRQTPCGGRRLPPPLSGEARGRGAGQGAETSPSNALRGTAFATSPFRGGKGRAGRARKTSPSNALRGTAFATSPFRGGKGRAGRAQKPLRQTPCGGRRLPPPLSGEARGARRFPKPPLKGEVPQCAHWGGEVPSRFLSAERTEAP